MTPPIAVPTIPVEAIESPRSAFACCSRSGLTVIGVSPVDAGIEERARRSRDRLQDHELPDVGRVREDQHRDCALRAHARDVGDEHHRAARQPVGEDAADEEERDERNGLRGEDVAEVGRRAGQVEHGERERDRRERVAEQRDELAREEQAELRARAAPRGR